MQRLEAATKIVPISFRDKISMQLKEKDIRLRLTSLRGSTGVDFLSGVISLLILSYSRKRRKIEPYTSLGFLPHHSHPRQFSSKIEYSVAMR